MGALRFGRTNLGKKIDTKAVGLDLGLSLIRWLTGEEHLHYGLWTGLEPAAANLKQAQDAYTDKLVGHLPEGKLSILDIGGGAGATARRLIALGHRVEIVVPSPVLAERCRANAPEATVHLMPFEEFTGKGPFDLCLFSESFQYVKLDYGLARCAELLEPGGHVLLADCFRTDAYRSGSRAVGGGHPVSAFRRTLSELPFEVVAEEELTEAVAPSVEIEQALFNIAGDAVRRIDGEIAGKRPWLSASLRSAWKVAVGRKRRENLARRLFETTRTKEAFALNNTYILMKLRRR